MGNERVPSFLQDEDALAYSGSCQRKKDCLGKIDGRYFPFCESDLSLLFKMARMCSFVRTASFNFFYEFPVTLDFLSTLSS
jgi:hypothetical protein